MLTYYTQLRTLYCTTPTGSVMERSTAHGAGIRATRGPVDSVQSGSRSGETALPPSHMRSGWIPNSSHAYAKA